ncbi:MAG: hypothetical protein AAFY56_22950, partial [Pseudomonadota bacterium]
IHTSSTVRSASIKRMKTVVRITGGGPGTGTRYIGLHIWRVVFPKTDYGYGAAMSLLTLYLTLVLCWLLYVAMVQRRTDSIGTGK